MAEKREMGSELHKNYETLPKVPFGNTGIEVTGICVGAAPVGGMPYGDKHLSEEEAIKTLIHILGGPIRFLDTASLYKESELRIGRAIREFGGLPEDFVIATKADRDPETGDFSAEQVARSVGKSQRLLGLEQLPIVYLHDPELSSLTFEQIMASDGPVARLQELKEEGRIGHIGISGGPTDMMKRYVETGAFEAMITHNRFTLLDKSAEILIDHAADKGLAVVNAAVYNGGILAKGADGFPYYVYETATKDVIERVRRLEELCHDFNIPLPAVALQFSLRNPKITSTVIGISTPQEVDQTLALSKIEIPAELWKELENFQAYTRDPES